MRRKLIIDGNAVYEIDDECVQCKVMREQVQSGSPKWSDESIRTMRPTVSGEREKMENIHRTAEKVNKNSPKP